MKCQTCGEETIGYIFEGATLVYYDSPLGHDHDDNCLTRRFVCKSNHVTLVHLRRNCPACDWRGRESCFCHSGKKAEVWPEGERLPWRKEWLDLL